MARFLFVDDEQLLLRSIARLTKQAGFDAIVEHDPRFALATVERERVDVLVADYEMPWMNGIDLLAKARLEHPQVVRVLMTGLADRPLAIEAINSGGVDFLLEKPWQPGELLDALRTLGARAAERRAAAADPAAAVRSFGKSPPKK